MKIQLPQDQLLAGLAMVARSVSAKSVLPILENVLIATDGGRLRLSGTNLTSSVTTWIPAVIDEEGAITLPAKILLDLVATLPKDDLVISLTEKTFTAHIHCAGSKTQVKGISAEDFPLLPVPVEMEGITLPAGTWSELINLVAFAAATDETRPILTGIHLSTQAELLTLVAADGFRLAVSQQKLPSTPAKPVELNIPSKSMAELSRILKDHHPELPVTLTANHRQAIFQTTNLHFAAQLIDGIYPDWQQIVPKKFATRTVLPTKGFITAVKQVEVFARESKHNVTLRIKQTPDGRSLVDFVGQGEEVGDTAVRVDASGFGEILVGFNGIFLKQASDAVRTPELAIQTTGNPNAPGMICPVGQDNYYCVLMPIYAQDIDKAAAIADAIEAIAAAA